jgi:hypothetical protein
MTCTAVAPDVVFAVRIYGTRPLYGPRLVRKISLREPQTSRSASLDTRHSQIVAQLRYLPPDPASRTSYAAGEIAQCDFWFPPVQVPCGFGQVRTAKQLPVLTMVTGDARWASAVLVPSRRAEDLFAG